MHLEIPINDNVFILHIAVNNADAVKIINGINNLGEDILRLSLCEPLVLSLLEALK